MKNDENIDNEIEELMPEVDDTSFEEEGATQADNIKKLKQALKESQKERAEYLEGWQRAKADYINLKNSSERERSEVVKYAQESILLDVINLADTFELAFSNKEAWGKVDEAWRKGVEYIYQQLERLLTDYGITTLNPINQTFDPLEHHSIGTIETEDKESDHKVLEVLKKGYKLNGKVIRPAQVKVGVVKI